MREIITNTVKSATHDDHNSTYFGHNQVQITKGREAADIFINFCIVNGYTLEKTDSKTDRYSHIDYRIFKNGECFCSVDVKAKSKYGWSGEVINNYGYPGSMFSQANFILYIDAETKMSYFVPPKRLQELHASKTFLPKRDTRWIMNHPNEPQYLLEATFGRMSQGRPDEIFFFTQKELEKIAEHSFSMA